MALFPRGQGNKQLIYVICIFITLWWTGLISIGDPHNDGNQPVVNLPHDRDHHDNDDQHDTGLVSWQPVASVLQNGQHLEIKNIPKRVSLMSSPITSSKFGKCKEKINFVYIKEIKCASQTLVNIFRRFGLERRLSFVTPIGTKLYLGWPWLIKPTYHRPSKTGEFHILCDHTVFDEDIIRTLMASEAVFITSLREPFAQFKSMFNYYAFQVCIWIYEDKQMYVFLVVLACLSAIFCY
jgi:hypothetical protein